MGDAISFRRSVATVVRDGLGIEAGQAQLSHSQSRTTENHHTRRTTGPDARGCWTSGQARRRDVWIYGKMRNRATEAARLGMFMQVRG
ncbi:hypothetical protein BHQ19_32305 [Mycolicibacterium porcinum]|nr:hypothetical protein BHQ19_32305 [Mycolicibacterium porcinum]